MPLSPSCHRHSNSDGCMLRGQLGVQYFAQSIEDTWARGTGDQIVDRLICRWPALPPGPQLPLHPQSSDNRRYIKNILRNKLWLLLTQSSVFNVTKKCLKLFLPFPLTFSQWHDGFHKLDLIIPATLQACSHYHRTNHTTQHFPCYSYCQTPALRVFGFNCRAVRWPTHRVESVYCPSFTGKMHNISWQCVFII